MSGNTLYKTGFFGMAAVVWQSIFLWLPIMLVCVTALALWNNGDVSASLDIFQGNVGVIVARSVLLTLATAFLCALVAYPLVYWVVFYLKRSSTAVLFLIMLPFWTNLLVLVYGWFFVLERNGLINTMLRSVGLISEPLRLLNTPGATYLLMVYCYLPYMVLPLYTALEKIDSRFIEASRDLGASAWQTFSRIILPLSLQGLRNGFYLVLIPAFGEFVIPALAGGGRYYYVGSLISHLFLISRDSVAGARFTVLSGIVLAGLCCVIELLYRYLRTRMGVEHA